MAGFKGRGSKVRIKDSSATYKLIPGVQDIVLNYPTVGTIDVSDPSAGGTAFHSVSPLSR
jgi:hypothetical protein